MTRHLGTYRPGTVVRYEPDPKRHDPRWCREGTAIADERGFLVDTYWSTSGDQHVVTAAEEPSIEVLFHLEDYRELDGYSSRASRDKWIRYATDDRQVVTSQHGLDVRYFVRLDAVEDRATIIANARSKVAAAEDEVASAQRHLAWAQQELDALLAEVTA